MRFVERFRKDKSFRFKIVLIFIAIVLMAGNVPGDKKEATIEECNLHNTYGFIATTGDYNACKLQGCVPEFQSHPGGLLSSIINFGDWLANLFGVQQDLVICKPKASVGKYIAVASLTEAKSSCSSGQATIIQDRWLGTDIYGCVTSGNPDDPNKPDPSSQCKGDFQRSLAGMLDSVDFMKGSGCKTKFYIVAFGAGIIGFTLLMASI